MKRVHCMREVFWYMSGERTSVYLTAELAASVEASAVPPIHPNSSAAASLPRLNPQQPTCQRRIDRLPFP